MENKISACGGELSGNMHLELDQTSCKSELKQQRYDCYSANPIASYGKRMVTTVTVC